MTAIRKNLPRVALIAVVWVLATACTIYVLGQERLQSPFANYYEVNAQFSNVDAVVPNLGEPVDVAGVKVGQITAVKLVNGVGVLQMRIDPHRLAHVYADASAVLVPNTPLKDMQVDIAPGHSSGPLLPNGGDIPLRSTTTPIDSDELLRALDGDTRTYLVTLLNGLGAGFRGRGQDVRTALRALGPTTTQLHEITALLASRRQLMSQLVSNLAVLTRAAGSQDRQLGQVVSAGDTTLRALAGQDAAIRASLVRLPGVLTSTQTTLTATTTFANTLTPTLQSLMPSARRLKSTVADLPPLLNGAGILPLRQVRDFTDASQPLAAPVRESLADVTAATPYLIAGTQTLNYTSNELAYGSGKDPGGLFWSTWFLHNADSVVSTGDANGAVVRGQLLVSCSSLSAPGGLGSVLQLLLGLQSACPPSQQAAQRRH